MADLKRTSLAGTWLRARWAWLLLGLCAAAAFAAWANDLAARTYDAATAHVLRGVVYAAAIRDGVLYPRWVQFLHWGLGSPLFTFQAPLPYYAMAGLDLVGISPAVGWRILVGLGLLAAGIGAYQLARMLTSRRWAALAAAVVFLYAPYILRDALERGSAEAFSTFLFPWVLWALLWLAAKPSVGRLVVASAIWAACIGLHVLAPLMLAPFAVAVALLAGWRHKTVKPVLALFAGALLTAFIWAPMAMEQRFVQVERDFIPETDPTFNPVPLDVLLAPPAVYDVARDNNGIGDRLGWVQVGLLVLAIPGTAYAWLSHRRRLALLLGGVALASLFLIWMLTSASDPLWQALAPWLRRLQYRTRLMGLQALSVSALAALLISLLPKKGQPLAAVAVAALALSTALSSMYVDLQHRYASFDTSVTLSDVREAEIRSGGAALTSYGEFTPRWREAPFDAALLAELGANFGAEARPLVAPPVGLTVQSAEVRTASWDLEISASEPTTLTLYLLYYPRWQASVDGGRVDIQPQPETGYVQLKMPAGVHRLQLRYGRTFAESAGLLASGATAVVLLGVAVYVLLQRRRARLPIAARPEAGEVVPPLWLLIGITLLFCVKVTYVDRQTTWLRCASTAQRVCGAQATVDVAFEGGLPLRGYSVSSYDLRRGGVLQVDLFWQGLPDATDPLRSFVHVRNRLAEWPDNPQTGDDIWASADHVSPGLPVSTEFLPGRLYLDRFRIILPRDMPPGEYYLEVGWYDLAQGQQVDPRADTVTPPLGILWRSILLPDVDVK